MRAEVHDILRFWLARGVSGFRMDVINLISKPWRADGCLPDAPVVQPGTLQPAFGLVAHGPQLLGWLRAMKWAVLAGRDLITVGEAPLATWLHGLQGTPFIYQGEELGMSNLPFASIDDCRNLESINHFHTAVQQRGQDSVEVMRSIRAKGRDNARTPVQWDASANAGFSTGTPWLAVNPNHAQINADQALADPDSMFHHYRQLIALRRSHPVWVHGRTVGLMTDHLHIAAYLREGPGQRLLAVCNFSALVQRFVLPDKLPAQGWQHLLGNWPLLLHNSRLQQLDLRPWEAQVLLRWRRCR